MAEMRRAPALMLPDPKPRCSCSPCSCSHISAPRFFLSMQTWRTGESLWTSRTRAVSARGAWSQGSLAGWEGQVSAQAADMTAGLAGTLATPTAPAWCLCGLHAACMIWGGSGGSAFENHQVYGQENLTRDKSLKKAPKPNPVLSLKPDPCTGTWCAVWLCLAVWRLH